MAEEHPEPTQHTRPKKKAEKPIEVPVPTREEVERDLRKLIGPEQPTAPKGRAPSKGSSPSAARK